jgi:hypothetical protein
MSTDEQDAAIGRLVKQRSEAKKHKALLENELMVAGRSLSNIGSLLKSVEVTAAQSIIREVENAPLICRLEHVKAMLLELKEAQELLAQLSRTAADIGID